MYFGDVLACFFPQYGVPILYTVRCLSLLPAEASTGRREMLVVPLPTVQAPQPVGVSTTTTWMGARAGFLSIPEPNDTASINSITACLHIFSTLEVQQ